MEDLHEIVAVVQCGWKKANKYLEHGYVLIKLADFSEERDMKPMILPDGSTRPRSMVQRYTTCVLGRTADTPAFDPVEEPVVNASTA